MSRMGQAFDDFIWQDKQDESSSLSLQNTQPSRGSSWNQILWIFNLVEFQTDKTARFVFASMVVLVHRANGEFIALS